MNRKEKEQALKSLNRIVMFDTIKTTLFIGFLIFFILEVIK